ncbi:MAG: hypothetical protein ABII06_00360, partial [Pseudomonadota bacterium]
MENLFKIITLPSIEKEERRAIQIGLRISLAGQQGVCPVTGAFDNVQALAGEVKRLKEQLDGLLKEAKGLLPEAGAAREMTMNSDLPPEEAWAALSDIPEEELFIRSFNGLEEEKRVSVAEYVLTQCNI